MSIFDIVIIGAGVIGASIARELSKFKLNVLLLEKESDISCGASKANSGIVHGGYDALPGTKKAKFNVAGNRMFENLNHELNFGYLKTGSYVLSFSEEEDQILYRLMDQGKKNSVRGMSLLNRDQILKREPYISQELTLGLYCREAGIVSPYEMVIALVENAVKNGVCLHLNSEVRHIEKNNTIFTVATGNSRFQTRFIINASGIYSDKISRLAGAENFIIKPKKGQYLIFNKSQGQLTRSVLFQVPGKKGKGILVTRTFHGNLMIGPNSEETEKKENNKTDQKSLNYIKKRALKTLPFIDLKKTIKSFAGLRATIDTHDFLIEESKLVKGFINVAGIDSPGLTSSPAIAKEVLYILENCGLRFPKNKTFDGYREAIIKKKDTDFNGKVNHKHPDQNIICRCEQVTESEIIDAMNRGIPVVSRDAVKRRTRSGMGPCQGKFCGPRVDELINQK